MLFFVLVLLPAVIAQVVDQASCTNSSWFWSRNSLNEDPCHVGQALGNQCDSSGEFSIPTLPAGYYYSGQSPLYASDCTCNTVYYSLLSVCGQCQNGYALPWGQWNGNCSRVYQQSFPRTLPSGFNVPDWAYKPLLSDGTVNFVAAQIDNNPESSAPASTGTPTSTASNSGDSSPKKVNIGAIVGGTVGGVAFLVLLALLIWLLCRNRKPRQPASAASNDNNIYAGHSPMSSEKTYNPNDPSTYVDQLPASPPITPGIPIHTDRNTFMHAPGMPEMPMPQQPQNNFQMPENMISQQQWQVQQPQMLHPRLNGIPLPEV